MGWSVTRILFVEDDFDYAQLVPAMLNQAKPNQFEVIHTANLADAVDQLERYSFDTLLLDLFLPDSQGLATFARLYSLALGIPIVILTANEDEQLALRCIREGAQEYLSKNEIDGKMLSKALRFAIERERTLARLKRESLVDDLTGLLNRRGFLAIGRQQLKIAKRSGRKLWLFYFDLDALKTINDRYGHLEGDKALRAAAHILRNCFRSSDVIGRMGGDEFTALAVDVDGGEENITRRIQQAVEQRNAANHEYAISLSAGFAKFEPASETTFEELLAEADQNQYKNKRGKSPLSLRAG